MIVKTTTPMSEREPAAVRDLDDVGAEEGEVDQQKKPADEERPATAASPSAQRRHDEDEDRRDHMCR